MNSIKVLAVTGLSVMLVASASAVYAADLSVGTHTGSQVTATKLSAGQDLQPATPTAALQPATPASPLQLAASYPTFQLTAPAAALQPAL